MSLFLLIIVSLASGCNTGKTAPTPANFALAINNHFLDHPDCLFTDTRWVTIRGEIAPYPF